jgi:hypothetical protein
MARTHAALQRLLALLPWWIAGRALLHRLGSDLTAAFDLATLALLAVLVMLALQHRDRRWLARRLDAMRPELEDSATLLWQAAPQGLAALQAARLRERVAALRAHDLQLAPRAGPLALNALLALVAAGLIAGQPWRVTQVDVVPAQDPGTEAAPASPALVAQQVRIIPPFYTGLPAQSQASLDASVPEGATVHWRLRIEPVPQAVALRFHDGETLALSAIDRDWQAERRIDRAVRYRLLVDGEVLDPTAAAARIDVIADQPPRISVSAPAQTLTLLDAAAPIRLQFEASDDHGLGAAELTLTLAQGDGEQVQVSERRLALSGSGTNTLRRYDPPLDLAALGFARGDDLILRVSVSDNRSPVAQRSDSPAYILRWPNPVALEAEGFDGLVQRTLPAYFRSQRQIIIDSEALLAARDAIEADRYLQRSDAIGVDQRLLRLRYGQFLGEEAESGAVAALPEGHHLDDGHDHGAEHAAASASDADAIIAEYGHLHDQAEAATLFDPATRELLRAALREMWQAELHLRQGAPELALPFEYRALDFIKRVQQANRVYLARVGLDLPPIDPGRRLSGDRSGLRPRPDPLVPHDAVQTAAEALWQSLGQPAPAVDRTAFDAFARWLREHESTLPDPLALHDAIDAVLRQPDCHDCVERLRALLWPLRPLPAAGVGLRPAPGTAGHAYLDALQQERP